MQTKQQPIHRHLPARTTESKFSVTHRKERQPNDCPQMKQTATFNPPTKDDAFRHSYPQNSERERPYRGVAFRTTFLQQNQRLQNLRKTRPRHRTASAHLHHPRHRLFQAALGRLQKAPITLKRTFVAAPVIPQRVGPKCPPTRPTLAFYGRRFKKKYGQKPCKCKNESLHLQYRKSNLSCVEHLFGFQTRIQIASKPTRKRAKGYLSIPFRQENKAFRQINLQVKSIWTIFA